MNMNLCSIFVCICIVGYGIVIEAVPTPPRKKTAPFTAEEVKAAEKLRLLMGDQLYKDYMRTDPYLIRWLRDQNGDIGNTKAKLEKTFKWRLDNKIDATLNEDFSDIRYHCPYYVSGRDKEGSPLLEFSLGQCALRRLTLSGKLEKLNRSFFKVMETLGREARSNASNGDIPEQVVFVADMQGFSRREHICLACFPYYSVFFDTIFNHYPDLIKYGYFVNLSRAADTLIHSVLGPFIPSNWKDKGKVLGYDKEEWKDEFKKFIDLSQLSSTFGGTGTRRLIT